MDIAHVGIKMHRTSRAICSRPLCYGQIGRLPGNQNGRLQRTGCM
jgi:hypothetical protein